MEHQESVFGYPDIVRSYCEPHGRLMTDLDAMNDVRRELIWTLHAWIDSSATVEEVQRLARRDVEVRAAIRRVVPWVGE